MKAIYLYLLFIMASFGCSCENNLGGDTGDAADAQDQDLPDFSESEDTGEMEECLFEVIDPGPLHADPFNVENAVCREDGWCWHWPYPVGAVLYGSTADSEGTVYAVGNYGTILRWPLEGSPSLLGHGEAGDSMLWSAWRADDGTLWIGGYKAGYETPVIFKYINGILERESITVVDPTGQNYGYIHRIKGHGEQLWAVGSKGYFYMPSEDKICLAFFYQDDSWHEVSPPCDSTLLNDIAFSPSGEVWIADPGGSLLVYNPSSASWRKLTPEPPHPWARLWWLSGGLYLFALDGTLAKMDAYETFVEMGSVPPSYQPRYDGSLSFLFPLFTAVHAGEDGTFTALVSRTESGISIYEVSEAGVTDLYGPDPVGYLVTTIEKQGDAILGFGSKGYTFSFSKSGLDEIYRMPPWDQHGISLWEQGQDIVAVTSGGFLLRFTGNQWEPVARVPGLSEDTMYSSGFPMWADDGCVYTANQQGVFRYMGSTWESIPYEKIDEGEYVESICGFSCENMYLTTIRGRLLRLAECGWEEIPPPDDQHLYLQSLWCKPPDKLYVSGSGLYLWEDGAWTIVVPAQRQSDGSWIGRKFVWGHEHDDTLYLYHIRESSIEELRYATMVRINGIWQEWMCHDGYGPCIVKGIRGFDTDTIWGFTNQSWIVVRPGDGDWESFPLLFSQPEGYPDNGIGAWVTREGKVFVLGAGIDIDIFSPAVRGMTVKTPE